MHNLRDANCKGIKNCGQVEKSEGEFRARSFSVSSSCIGPSPPFLFFPVVDAERILDYRSFGCNFIRLSRSFQVSGALSLHRWDDSPPPPPSICNKRDGHLSSSFPRHDSFPAIKSQGKIWGETKGVRLLHSFFVICRPPPTSFLYRADDGGPLGTEKRKSSGLSVFTCQFSKVPLLLVTPSNDQTSLPLLLPNFEAGKNGTSQKRR